MVKHLFNQTNCILNTLVLLTLYTHFQDRMFISVVPFLVILRLAQLTSILLILYAVNEFKGPTNFLNKCMHTQLYERVQ